MNRHGDGPPILGMVGNALPLIGVLKDFFPHTSEERLRTDYAVGRYERKVQASAGRWVSLVLTGGILALFAFGLHGGLAPLLILGWLFFVNRLVWMERGNPSPKAAVKYTRLGFLMLAASVAATLFALLFALFPFPFFSGAATVAALVTLVLAIVDPFFTARAIREAQVPEAPDMTLFEMVVLIVGIRRSVYEAGLADGSFTVEETGDKIVSHVPLEAAGLLLDRDGMDARCRDFYPDFEIGTVDAPRFLLTLTRVEEETKIRRDAMARSGDLFAEHLGTGLDDLEVIDLGLHEQPLPRLS